MYVTCPGAADRDGVQPSRVALASDLRGSGPPGACGVFWSGLDYLDVCGTPGNLIGSGFLATERKEIKS